MKQRTLIKETKDEKEGRCHLDMRHACSGDALCYSRKASPRFGFSKVPVKCDVARKHVIRVSEALTAQDAVDGVVGFLGTFPVTARALLVVGAGFTSSSTSPQNATDGANAGSRVLVADAVLRRIVSRQEQPP